ncbi:hypothetical protein RHGRI_017378 [Rhododendron griersonianum]|uniref:Uncharacterized protein n=1 Tax=Rhododendron griersonianum TaxID=479676 RepID=A0AAV6JXJ5_9ERIC|nr:hypothetical protein RHGRI_017378 [Rhododendron griersonianum]
MVSLNLDRVSVLKSLFGLPFNTSGADDFLEENIKYIEDLTNLLGSKISDEKYPTDTDEKYPRREHKAIPFLFYCSHWI